MNAQGPLLHRPIEHAPSEDCRGWPMKQYRITAESPAAGVGSDWEDQARELTRDVMSAQPRTAGQPEAGFRILHHGALGNWLLIDWWRGDVLHQQLFFAGEGSAWFGPPPPNVVACSFELVVTDHERRSWARHVLGADADVDAYLADLISVEGGLPYA